MLHKEDYTGITLDEALLNAEEDGYRILSLFLEDELGNKVTFYLQDDIVVDTEEFK